MVPNKTILNPTPQQGSPTAQAIAMQPAANMDQRSQRPEMQVRASGHCLTSSPIPSAQATPTLRAASVSCAGARFWKANPNLKKALTPSSQGWPEKKILMTGPK